MNAARERLQKILAEADAPTLVANEDVFNVVTTLGAEVIALMKQGKQVDEIYMEKLSHLAIFE